MSKATMTIETSDGKTSELFTLSDLQDADKVLKSGMKQTDADRDVTDKAFRCSAEHLRTFIQRIERLEAEKKEIAEAQKVVYLEAKGGGYDTKVIREIVKIRKQDPRVQAEFEAVLELYRSELGM